MQALNADSLRYSCLELRFCIEFLVIGRLQAYLDEVGDEALKKWTPKDIMTEILAVDPHGDKSIAVSLGIRSPSGAPMAVLTPLGDDRRFDMRWANKSYNTLATSSMLLHSNNWRWAKGLTLKWSKSGSQRSSMS